MPIIVYYLAHTVSVGGKNCCGIDSIQSHHYGGSVEIVVDIYFLNKCKYFKYKVYLKSKRNYL